MSDFERTFGAGPRIILTAALELPLGLVERHDRLALAGDEEDLERHRPEHLGQHAAYGQRDRRAALAVVDVPTSTCYGSTPGASFCFIAGHEVPFDDATLKSSTRRTGCYIRKVVRESEISSRGATWTVADGLSLIRDAARADVP